MSKFSNVQAVKTAINKAKQLLRPPPNLKPSEWAEGQIRIPVGNAVPGLIRFANAPYQREPLDMLVDPECYRVTLQWAAQVGKTQLALCGQAYHIAMKPVSQMMMQPSQGDLQVWMNSKFNPMVDANQSIRDRLATPRGRDGVNNSTMKSYPGGFLMFAWSGSAKTMRGRSAPLIVADEVDGYEATEEGHPVSLLWQRAATFSDRKLMEISTPTVKGVSYIEKAFEAGDQRRFHVACPDCGHIQTLSWPLVKWEGRVSTGLDDAHLDLHERHLPATASYTCVACGSLWNDGQRIASIRLAEANGGGWKAEKPFRGHASYHLNELYSTFRRLKDIVQSYLDKLATDDFQTFVNVSLAETFEEKGEQADPDGMMARAEDYPAPVPQGGLVLTAGVDMQADRLECEIVAWGHGEESWSIDYVVLWGDPLQGDVWEELEQLLSSTWLHESGAQMPITAACVDTGGSGGTTQAAYEWLRGKTGRRIFGIKGVSGWGRPIVAAPSRKQSGNTVRKIDLFLVGVDEAKLTVMRRLGVMNQGPGYCHVPKDRGADWYQQMTAEKLLTRYSKGFPVREWHQTRPRNEALDCRVYALAALKISNPSFKRASERLAYGKTNQKAHEIPKSTLDKPIEVKQTHSIKRSLALKKRGGWVSNW
jgi:phage terminase large subunit GpA-like protein